MEPQSSICFSSQPSGRPLATWYEYPSKQHHGLYHRLTPDTTLTLYIINSCTPYDIEFSLYIYTLYQIMINIIIHMYIYKYNNFRI